MSKNNFWRPAPNSFTASFGAMLKPGLAADFMKRQDYELLGEVAERYLVNAIADNLDISIPSPRNSHRARIVLRHLKRIHQYENAIGFPALDEDVEADLVHLFSNEYRILESIKTSIDNCWPVADIIKSIDRMTLQTNQK